MPLPYGFSVWKDEDILGGYNRAPWIVENEDEVRLAFAEHSEPRLTCSYCGVHCERTRVRENAVRWFHAHDCKPQEAAEAAGILWDAGALEPDHPFSQAA